MNYAYILFGALCIAGAVYVIITEFTKKTEEDRNKKGVFGSAGVIVAGIAFILSGIFDDISIFAFVFVCLLGGGFTALGIVNLSLYNKCSVPIDAQYIRCKKTGKRGENAIPVFSYTYEGKEYTSVSTQTVPSNQIGSKFRTDLPCRLYINPKKPQASIIKTEKPVDDTAKIIIGIILIAGAFVLHYYMNLPGVQL